MKLILKIILITLFITAINASFFELSYAKEKEQLELPKTTVYPGSVYYPLKRLLEKGQEKLNFSKGSKVSFHRLLLKTRFTELDYVIGNNYLSEIQKSSERFAYQAGVLTEELLKEDEDKRKESIKREFKLLNKLLNNLKNKYDANSSYRMLIQHDINSLNILSERIK